MRRRKIMRFIGNKTNLLKDIQQVIKEISGDILYLDSTYNERQYLSNYHFLETKK
ncbi:MAG: DNA adenine methylase [Clostridia bacterium]|nr:DNA adenine methylase [Clostridia bacterium]